MVQTASAAAAAGMQLVGRQKSILVTRQVDDIARIDAPFARS